MLVVNDDRLNNMLQNLAPSWDRLAMRRRFFSSTGPGRCQANEIAFIGTPTLTFFVGCAVFPGWRIDYFPIQCKSIDPASINESEWLIFAQSRGLSIRDRGLAWLFERPSLQLLMRDDQLSRETAIGSDVEDVRFPGGVRVSSSHGNIMTLICSQMSDFLLQVTIA